MIEVRDFFAKNEILQQRGAVRIGPERVLIVGNRHALVRGQWRVRSTCDLVKFTAGGRL